MPANNAAWAFWLSLLIWTGLYAWSFVAFAQTEATGDGFTRGSNRIGQFLMFQMAAGLTAIFVWRKSNDLSASALRWLARLPSALFLLLISGIAAFFICGIFFV